MAWHVMADRAATIPAACFSYTDLDDVQESSGKKAAAMHEAVQVGNVSRDGTEQR